MTRGVNRLGDAENKLALLERLLVALTKDFGNGETITVEAAYDEPLDTSLLESGGQPIHTIDAGTFDTVDGQKRWQVKLNIIAVHELGNGKLVIDIRKEFEDVTPLDY